MRLFWKHTVLPIDPNTLPKNADVLRRIVLDLCERLRHESSEKDKYRSLLRELLDAQRNRKSEQLSKEQLALFEAFWKASEPQEDSEPDAGEEDKPEEPQVKKRSGRAAAGKGSDPGTDRARSGRSREALQLLRQGSEADRRRDQRTLRVHSILDEGDRGCAAEVRLRLHSEDGGQAFAAD